MRIALCLLAACALACGPGEITTPSSAAGPGPDAGSVATGPCATTCDGCCYGDVCFTGNDVRGCGKGGQMCQTCSAGTTCTNRACGASTDPCGGVSPNGQCVSTARVEVCVVPTGAGTPTVQMYDCPSGQVCRVSGGVAGCGSSGDCTDGASRCSASGGLETCASGKWTSATCVGQCVSSPLGASCNGGGAGGTLSGNVMYTTRKPLSDRSDWGDSFDAPAQGFLISSVRVANGQTTVIDSQVTSLTEGSAGAFTLKVPQPVQSTDFIIVYAAGRQADGSLSFLVADPRLSAGTHNVDDPIPNPALWSWSWRTDSVTNGGTLTIGIDKGSGAARIFDYLRYVYALSDARWPGAPKDPIIIWLGMGVEWDCGACNWGAETSVLGQSFTDQIFFGGGSDEGYWADAVTVHELGHWAMFMFGHAVGEGGKHCIGTASAPGLAWSEGWATWFSSDARGSPLYVDKQDGAMFWLDMSTRATSDSPWPRPVASRGLEQDIYENEITAMMWNLSSTQGLGRRPFDAALASSRMTVSPFARGYTRHTWDVNANCVRSNISDTGEPTTFFADMLDALVCGGVTASQADTATQPSSHYPYPSRSPLCQ
jgi:hypothetical protein